MESEPGELSRGRTRSRSCSPTHVNATHLSPVPQLKFQDDEEDQESGSASSSPNSSPIDSATSGSLRRERSHSSPAIGRRDRSRSDLMSPGAQSRHDGMPRSGGGRKAAAGDSIADEQQRGGWGEQKAVTTSKVSQAGWGDLPARELSTSLDAVAVPSGDESSSSTGTKNGEKDKQLSPPRIEATDAALEGSHFPALSNLPTQPVTDDPAASDPGSRATQSSASVAGSEKSAWGGRSFAAIVRAGSTDHGDQAPASKSVEVDRADARVVSNTAASSGVEPIQLSANAAPTIAVTVTVSPNSQPAADRNKGAGGRPVKLTGAWQQQTTKPAAHVKAAELASAQPAASTNDPHSAAGQAQPTVETAGRRALDSDGDLACHPPRNDSGGHLRREGSETVNAEGKADSTGSQDDEGRRQQTQVAEQGEQCNDDEEDCGVDMSPQLIGLGIGPRVDTTVWELDAAPGSSGSESQGGAGSEASGNDDDIDASMSRVQMLIKAVPTLLQAGRVALPGASGSQQSLPPRAPAFIGILCALTFSTGVAVRRRRLQTIEYSARQPALTLHQNNDRAFILIFSLYDGPALLPSPSACCRCV